MDYIKHAHKDLIKQAFKKKLKDTNIKPILKLFKPSNVGSVKSAIGGATR